MAIPAQEASFNIKTRLAVFFDEIPFLGNASGGIARSTVALAEALARQGAVVMGLGFRQSQFLRADALPSARCRWRFLPWGFRKNSGIRTLVRRGLFFLFQRGQKSGCRVIYQSNGIGSDPWIARQADLHVATIHDLIPERLDPPPHHKKTSAILQRRKTLQTAHGLVWVSENTRRDFQCFYPQVKLPGRIVLHGKPKVDFRKAGKTAQDLFLMVGNREGYKNGFLVYRALARFPLNGRPRLQLVGGNPPSKAEMDFWKRTNLSSSIRWESSSEKGLEHFYQRAMAVVVPSTIEGFGLPALEAMAHGRVVICLKNSGVDDVVGDAGIVLHDSCPRTLFRALRSLLQPAKRIILEKKARRRALRFDWGQTARKVLGFYRELLQR